MMQSTLPKILLIVVLSVISVFFIYQCQPDTQKSENFKNLRKKPPPVRMKDLRKTTVARIGVCLTAS